tara:strand:+ start:519 stop:1202 length:684 start_codon:yes stop_codon:yes gene_type:complete
MKKKKEKTVVLLSGGLDSSVTLSIAQKSGYESHCISFDYEQRHSNEINLAKFQSKDQKAKTHKIIKMDFYGGSALTDNIPIPKNENYEKIPDNIPKTYVPGRNLIFLSYAIGYAEYMESNSIFIGVNAVDYSGYPDCRPDFIKSFQKTSNLATKKGVEGGKIKIYTPLIDFSKRDIILEGKKNNVNLKKTLSCYNPVGFKACGRCDACLIRIKGFNEANLKDPISYV